MDNETTEPSTSADSSARIEPVVSWQYTRQSLTDVCADILGDTDRNIPLPVLLERAAVELFRTKTGCDSLCLQIRAALNDLHRNGEFNFAC